MSGRSAIREIRRRAESRPDGYIADFYEEVKNTDYCFWCEHELCPDGVSDTSKSLDHIIPSSQGGGLRMKNLVVSCHKCNQDRGNIDFIEYGIMKILQSTYPDRYNFNEARRTKLREINENNRHYRN